MHTYLYYVVNRNFKDIYTSLKSEDEAFTIKDIDYAIGLAELPNTNPRKFAVKVLNSRREESEGIIYNGWQISFKIVSDSLNTNLLQYTIVDSFQSGESYRTSCNTNGVLLAWKQFKEYSKHHRFQDFRLLSRIESYESNDRRLTMINKELSETIKQLITEKEALAKDNRDLKLQLSEIKRIANRKPSKF